MATQTGSINTANGSGGTSFARYETKSVGRNGRVKKDITYRYTLPKGRYDKLVGSFSYTPLSTKARQLQQNIYRLQGKLSRVQYENLSPKERAKKANSLRRQLSYLSCKLNTEVGSLSTISVVVEAD